MTGSITMRGDKELRAKFKALGTQARGDAGYRALIAAAGAMESALVRSLKTTPSKARNRAGEAIWKTGRLGVIGTSPETVTSVLVGTHAPYAARVEFGFTGRDSMGRMYHQPPNPWFRPAIKKAEATMRRRILETLRALLGIN